MAIKVNEFIIQAKVIEDEDGDQVISNETSETGGLPSSLKQEIIDECIDKMRELLDRERTRY